MCIFQVFSTPSLLASFPSSLWSLSQDSDVYSLMYQFLFSLITLCFTCKNFHWVSPRSQRHSPIFFLEENKFWGYSFPTESHRLIFFTKMSRLSFHHCTFFKNQKLDIFCGLASIISILVFIFLFWKEFMMTSFTVINVFESKH